MDALVKQISKFCKKVVLLSGTGTDRIKNKIHNKVEAGSMKEAVSKARSFAESGDIILLSPAYASFGMFKNEYDRGDKFMALVKKLK